MKGINFSASCYNCKFASIERISDITLGDAWGQLSDTDESGVSLILCQSDKGIRLVENSNLELFDVDLEKAMDSNPQLKSPSIMPDKRDKFLELINKGLSIKNALFKSYPIFCFKRLIKSLLIKLNFL